jgi:hypothetical protein
LGFKVTPSEFSSKLLAKIADNSAMHLATNLMATSTIFAASAATVSYGSQLVILEAGITPSAEQVQPVINRTQNYFNKPQSGGLWTSSITVRDPSDWAVIGGLVEGMVTPDSQMWRLTPKSDTRILHITDRGAFDAMMSRYRHTVSIGPMQFAVTDFERLSHDFDALHVTQRAISEVSATAIDPTDASLYGWDLESTLWFRWMFEQVEHLGPVPEKYTQSAADDFDLGDID